jgi:HlyD family secretion protein
MNIFIKRYGFWTALGIITLLLLVYGMQPEPVLSETTTIRKGTLSKTISEEGHTRVINRYVIFSPVAGYLRRVEYNIGDTAKLGDALIEIEPLPSDVLDPRRQAEAKARVAAAESALKAARENAKAMEADADYARTEFERKSQLKLTQAISGEELQQAKTSLQRSEAQLRSARFTVKIAEHELEAANTLLQFSGSTKSQPGAQHLTLKAPVNGAILEILRKSEGVIAAGEPILEIGNAHDLEVVVEVLSEDAVNIKPETRVELKRWGGTTLQAQVKRVEPVAFTEVSALGVEEQRVRVIVDILSPPESWEDLGDGYRVDAEFVLWQQEDTLIIPEAAIIKEGKNTFTYKVENNKAEYTPIKAGRSNGLEAELTEGLENGAEVIVYPGNQVADNTSIIKRE